MRTNILHSTALCALVFSGPVLASGGSPHVQSTGGPQVQQATRVEVTPAGAFTRVSESAVRALPDARETSPADPTSNLTSGVIWTKTDGGLAWIATAVSIGNFGSEVFTEYDQNNQSDQLFSSFDTNPPTALLTDTSPLGTANRHVASANATNLHVAMNQLGNSTTVRTKYQSSVIQEWTYTFNFAPASTGEGSGLGVSRDGQTIVAAVSHFNAATVDIAVFSPASNVPLSYTTVQLGGAMNEIRGFDLSADGSTLYFSSSGVPVTAYIFDIATQTVVFSTPIGSSFDSHAISGDGSVFAYGLFNGMKVWEKVGGVYTNLYTRTLAGQNYCARIDISDDSQTIAYGFYLYNPGLTTRIEALDVPSHTVTMTDVVTATGVLQNIIGDISISADGQRFAAGLWGDGSGPVAEARLYAKNQNTPLGTINLQGSVFSIRISADGQRMVAGSKAVHANTQGNGGQVNLFGDNTPFTNFCFGDGSLATFCPCGNVGLIGHGCRSSHSAAGALLTATGATSPDTVVLTSSQELPSVLSIFLQGQTTLANGIVFGDGLRCVNTNLKRLYTKNASGGVVSAPGIADPSITARSAALGDTILPGTPRYYQTYYRDPVLGFCSSPNGDSWNVSNAVQVDW